MGVISLLEAAVVLPIGAVALTLPPLLQLEAISPIHADWPPFEYLSRLLLQTKPSRLSLFLDLIVTDAQRKWIVYHDNAFPGVSAPAMVLAGSCSDSSWLSG